MQNSKFLGLASRYVGCGAARCVTQTKSSEKTGTLALEPFEYTGPRPATFTEATKPENYQPLADSCQGTGRLCAIMAEPSANPDEPIISGNVQLQTAISDYLSTGSVDPLYIQERN